MKVLILFIVIVLSAFSCQKQDDKVVNSDSKRFGIYLTVNDVPPDRLIMMSHIDLAENPIISEDDIVVYIRQTHSLVLTENAKKRLGSLEIPVRGKSFLVCVDRQIKYDGAFWTPISSIPFRGVVIVISKPVADTLRLQLGYPEGIDSTLSDPRNNEEVMSALDKAGKLK